MKISKYFIVAIILLFVVLLLVEIKLPSKFVWEKTYRHSDPNPYGAQLVDSLLSSSVKQGYDVKFGDYEDAFNDSSSLDKSVILVDMDFSPKILEMLKRGQNVLWINNCYLSDSIAKVLDFDIYDFNLSPGYYGFNKQSGIEIIGKLHLKWKKDSIFDTNKYDLPDLGNDNVTIVADIYNDTCKVKPLLISHMSDNKIYAATRNYGKGKLVVVCYPVLFTNYYALEPGGAELIMRLVSELGNAAIVRYDNSEPEIYLDEEVESKSVLRFFLQNRSLRWAVYLTLLTIVLSLIFTARRKQRVIPEIKEPENQTLNMVKHIGLMYYRYHDNASLVRNKFNSMTNELRRVMLIDYDNQMNDDENFKFLSQHTAIDFDTIRNTFYRAREIVDNEDVKPSDNETKELIDIMNKILSNI